MPKYNYPKLKLPKSEQRKFLEKIFDKSGLGIENLAELINVSPRTIRDWKREKYNISKNATDKLCKFFDIAPPYDEKKLIYNWLKIKIGISRKGAIARYNKYGNFGTLEGRRKGGSKALKILREQGLIPLCKYWALPKNKSVDLAEFVGIMLGDGGITKEQATVTLNSEADKHYIEYVISLGRKLFRNKPAIVKKKDCKATDLRYSGIKLVNFLISIGLKRGNKVKQQVGVPDWIQKSNTYKLACLKGLMDTDGCVVVSTHKVGLKRYVYYNPCFANRSKPLLDFVADTLREQGLHPSVVGERIWLYNKAEIRAYFDIIGSSNARLLKFKEMSPSGMAADC